MVVDIKEICNSIKIKSVHSNRVFIAGNWTYFLITIQSFKMVRYLGMIFLFIFQVFLLDVHVAAEFISNDYYNYYNTNYSSYPTNVGQKRVFEDYIYLGLHFRFCFILMILFCYQRVPSPCNLA